MKRLKLTNLMMVVAAMLGGVVMTRAAEGSLIEFTFGGQLEQVIGTPPAPWGGISVGSEFLVTMVFDTETPDQNDSFLNGIYAVESLSVTMDGVALAAGSAEIVLRRTNPFQHRYSVNFWDLPNGVVGSIELIGILALNSDALPTTLDLDDWFIKRFEAGLVNDAGFGTVTTLSSRIVPSPGILGVFAVAASLNRKRRKRKLSRPE